MDINMHDIGNRIKSRRKELQLTQSDIHQKCGIASGALSQIESGSRTPSAIILYKLSTALDCSTDWLITGISTTTSALELTDFEKNFILIMRDLPLSDREEIYEILQIKLRKIKKAEENH